MKKRGQITLFVIIGIVVVTLLGTVIYYNTDLIQSSWERERQESYDLPEKAFVVKEYVEDCLDITSREAIELLGQQGGFISLPQENQLGLGNSLKVMEGYEVVYWKFQQENGVEKEQIPLLESMEREISNYVKNNLDFCLNDFRELNEEGYSIEKENIIVKTEILPREVRVTMEMETSISYLEEIFNLKRYYSKLSVNLGELYESSKEIISSQKEGVYLEEKTIDMMAAYEEIPYSGVVPECGTQMWQVEDVESDFKNIIRDNIQFIKLKGTDYEIDNKYWEWDIGNIDPNLIVNLRYDPNWPLIMDINPKKGRVLKSESITAETGPIRGIVENLFCMQNYHFVYDVQYPVLVMLRDESSFNGEGYSFQFATDVVIKRNQPREAEILPEETYQLSNYDYCDKRYNLQKIRVYDSLSNSPLSEVFIDYKCINHFCDVGLTENGIIQERFPVCVNGFVVASKEGYQDAKQQLSTNRYNDISIYMERIVDVPIAVEVLGRTTNRLSAGDQVMITLESEDYITSAVYPMEKTIELVPGNYEGTIYLMKHSDKGLRLKEKEIEDCAEVPKSGILGYFGETEEQCTKITIPSMKVNDIMTGMDKFNVYVSRGDLSLNALKFYVEEQKIPTTSDELAEIKEKEGEDPIFI